MTGSTLTGIDHVFSISGSWTTFGCNWQRRVMIENLGCNGIAESAGSQQDFAKG